MYKFNIKSFSIAFSLFIFYCNIFCQNQICKCNIVDNYRFKDYEESLEYNLNRIYTAMVNIRDGLYTIDEYTFNTMWSPFNEILPPYSIKREIERVGYGIPNWISETDDSGYNVVFKKPFNTYIDEQKNFDVMFGIAGSYSKPMMVVKNYFENSQYQSLDSKKLLIIDDEEFKIYFSYGALGNNYKEQNLPLKSGVNVVAYRTVRIYELPIFEKIEKFDDREPFLASLINKIKPGKVSIVYETSTGQIKRVFNEAQVKNFKEMLQIYYNFQFDKFEVTYLNEQVKKECEEMEAQVAKDNEEHYTRLKPIEDKINEVIEKYKKF